MFVLKGKGTFRHLGYADRIKIEALQKAGTCVKEIAAYIGCSVSTVYRELKRGSYKRLTSEWETVSAYSADIAQQDYDYKATAKGAAMGHLLFNVLGTILFMIISLTLPFADWVISLSPDNMRLQIAIVHVIFNVTTTAVLLPLAKWLERAACLLVRGKDGRGESMRLKYFDSRLMNTPPIAVAQLFKEVQRMGAIADANFTGAMACFHTWNEERAQEIMTNADGLDFLNKEGTARLVEVKGLELSERDTRLVGSMFHVINDMERVGDHSVNVLDAARLKEQENVKFTEKATRELEDLSAKVESQLQTAFEIFRTQRDTPEILQKVEQVEEEIDQTTEALRNHHVDRLKNKKCSARNGMLYLDMLTNLERIGDHAEHIATSVDKEAPSATR